MKQQKAWVKRQGKWSEEVINKSSMKLTKKRHSKPKMQPPKNRTITLDTSKPIVHSFTDGACEGNGKEINKGGYAFAIVEDGKLVHEYKNGAVNTTNNKMELQAIIDCLNWIKSEIPDTQVLLHSDSEYCVNGVTLWYIGWLKKDWKEVKNIELWKELIGLKGELPNVQYKWIRAHQTDDSYETTWNRHVDLLAVEACTGKREEDKVRKRK